MKEEKKLHLGMCRHLKQVLEELIGLTRNSSHADCLVAKGGDAYLCYQWLLPCIMTVKAMSETRREIWYITESIGNNLKMGHNTNFDNEKAPVHSKAAS